MDKKEIRQKAIRQIFEETSLKEKGFSCTKKSIHKKEGNLKFSLDFSSAISANHIEEVNIFEVRANVRHEGLRKYKKEKLDQDNGCIGGGLIENLSIAGPPWMRYDLGVTEASYNEQLKRIKNVIEKDVFYFFEEYLDEKKILNQLWKPCFDLSHTIHLFVFSKADNLLKELLEMVSVNRSDTFKQNYINFNSRLFGGEKWIDINEDVKDGEDRLSLEIANSFFEMGIKLCE